MLYIPKENLLYFIYNIYDHITEIGIKGHIKFGKPKENDYIQKDGYLTTQSFKYSPLAPISRKLKLNIIKDETEI